MTAAPQTPDELLARIGTTFDSLPAELRKAARYVASHPAEVAFHSMRSVAVRARVSPATMMRLAKVLGLQKYEQLRGAFQAKLRTPPSFLARARKLRVTQSGTKWMAGIHNAIDQELASIHDCIENLDDHNLEKITNLFAAARRLYVIGLRGMYPAAFVFHYSASIFSRNTVLVDGSGGIASRRDAGYETGDVGNIFTCQLVLREIPLAADFAHKRGVKIAVTDSPLSPAALCCRSHQRASYRIQPASRHPRRTFLSPGCSPAACGGASVAAIRQTDQHVAAFDI
ncbi:MAG: MurR/RpiR family transcriptional regulator [Burkholderiales bacterium]|nr:MurR/RpiR family transcriptional regulator [Burkholderiales bacterium]